jgi:hypothetical protein
MASSSSLGGLPRSMVSRWRCCPATTGRMSGWRLRHRAAGARGDLLAYFQRRRRR